MRFLSVSTAVKLLLIVALATQPMLAYATASGCGADGSTCVGCGCCEVENAADRCGCCGGTSESTAEQMQERDCCVRESSERPPAEGHSGPEASDAQRPSLIAAAGKTASAVPSGGLRSCSCEQQTQPLRDASSQRTSSESRGTIAVGYLAFDASSLGDVAVNSAERRNAELPAPQHVAQVLLCIWRL